MLLFAIGCAGLLGTDVAPEIQMTVQDTGYADIDVTMSAVVSDNHDLPSELLLQWTSDLDGELSFEEPDSEGNLSVMSLFSMGTHTISLRAEDMDGNETVVSKELLIGPENTPPSCSFLSNEEFWPESAPIELAGQASDPDIPSDQLVAEWFSDIDGSLGFGAVDVDGNMTLQLEEMTWNEHQVTVVVTDEVGATCESTARVRVGHVPNISYCESVLDWSEEWKTFEEEVVILTNELRTQGTTCDGEAFPPVQPLTMQRNLRCSSRVHSKDMQDRNYFDHTNPSGEDPGDRIGRAEYPWNSYGENIAYGYATPEEVVEGWHQSPGHCRNMMSDWFDEIGVGAYAGGNQIYWTQNFGSR